jgi:HAMP domain-containing protein
MPDIEFIVLAGVFFAAGIALARWWNRRQKRLEQERQEAERLRAEFKS